ncbi:MAG: PspC domain-containing protein [Bdellovibrionales bacterium]|nr:PspC domain-containing protein [Bdellovibrionales bacterium]
MVVNTESSAPRFLRGEGVIAGVAAGIAADFKADVILVRIAWVAAVCLGFGFFLYPILWIALPKASDPTLGNESRLMGVCNQVASRWGQPVGLVRLLAITIFLFSGGTAIFGYLLTYLLLGKGSTAQKMN